MEYTTGFLSSPGQDQAIKLENVTNNSHTEAPFVKKYDDSLIENVLEFAETNSLTAASRRFDIPHSTIYTWQKKKAARGQPKKFLGQSSSARAGLEEQQEHNNCKMSAGFEPSSVTKKEVVAFAKKHKSYVQAEKQFGFTAAAIKSWAKEEKVAAQKAEDDGGDDDEFTIEKAGSVDKSKRVREYSDQVKQAAVKYGKKHGWTAAAVKFKTSSTSVSRWATYHDPKSPWKLKVIMAAQLIGSKEASKKFKVAHATLEEWMRESGKFCSSQIMDSMWGDISMATEDSEESCQVCGESLAPGQTVLEHLVSNHLTESGLCAICGADEDDFQAHISTHFGDTTGDEQETDEDANVNDLLKDLLGDD